MFSYHTETGVWGRGQPLPITSKSPSPRKEAVQHPGKAVQNVQVQYKGCTAPTWGAVQSTTPTWGVVQSVQLPHGEQYSVQPPHGG